MSEPQYIILPVQGQNGEQMQVGNAKNVFGASQMQDIAQNIQHKGELPKQNGHSQDAAPKKEKSGQSSLVQQVTTDPSLLYSFINWEKPGQTFASLIAILSLIISTRYLSPVQWILKTFCIVLGATSLTEAIGRVASKDGIISRIRPKEYYRPSDQTYSRLFSELREAVDQIIIKLQNIIFTDDLQNTTIAFALTFAAFWLIKAIPPFWLAIVTTLLTYTLGAFLTRQSPEALSRNAQHLKNRAGETASSAINGAVNTSQKLGNQAADIAQDLGNRTKDTANYATDRASGIDQDFKNQANHSNNPFTSNSNNATESLQNIKNQATNSNLNPFTSDGSAGNYQDRNNNNATDQHQHQHQNQEGEYPNTTYPTTTGLEYSDLVNKDRRS